MASMISRLPLTLILVICALADLLLRRVGAAALGSHVGRDSVLLKIVDVSGNYFFYLSGLLALALFGWASMVAIRDRALLPIAQRMVFTLLSAMFLPMALVGVTVGVPHFVSPHVSAVFGLFLLALMVGMVTRRAPLVAKLGVLYLIVPLLLRCLWRLTQFYPALGLPGLHDNLPTLLYRASEHLLVVGAYAVCVFFVPMRRRADLFRPLPLAVAAVATVAAVVLTRYNYELARQLVDLGLGVVLPEVPAKGLLHPDALMFLLHFAGLFFLVLTVAALARGDQRQRGTALGLVLVTAAGFHVQLPAQPMIHQFLLTLVGLMLIIRSVSEDPAPAAGQAAARGPGPSFKDLNIYLQQLAQACAEPPDSGEAVMLQTDGQQVGHVRGQRGGQPFTVRLVYSGGVLDELELILGSPDREPAPVSLGRKRGQRGRRIRRRAMRERVRVTDDAQFDRQFVAHDSTDSLAPMLASAELRRLLEQQVHGWVGLWPGEGARYVSAPAEDGWPVPLAEIAFAPQDADTEQLASLLELMEQLRRGVDQHLR